MILDRLWTDFEENGDVMYQRGRGATQGQGNVVDTAGRGHGAMQGDGGDSEAARLRALTARVTNTGRMDGENDEVVKSDSMLQRKTTPAPPQPPVEDSVESGEEKGGDDEDGGVAGE